MNDAGGHAWWDLGYFGVFGCVFLEQIGVPIPAFPALLAAGTLAVSGEMNLAACLAVAIVAALLADSIWYRVGWVRGGKVLNLMCRVSWRPDTCVSKTKGFFSRHGTKTLLFAKFVPGLSTLAPPLAGITQVPFEKFVLYDAIGALVWAAVPLVAEVYLHESLKALRMRAHSFESYIPWVCGVLIVAVLTWHFVNRRRYLKELEKSLSDGMEAEELKSLLDVQAEVVVLDIRDELSAKERPLMVPTARWMPYSGLAQRLGELPLEKPIVVYCDCPGDQASGGVSDLLKQKGAKKVRALLGGLEGWVAKGYGTTEWRAE